MLDPIEENDRMPEWDVFISHSSEDKEAFVQSLASALRAKGLRVWFDEFTLRVGDSLRRMIDLGLSSSRYGVVVISPSFLRKEWPKKELDGLIARESAGLKLILPVWHDIDLETIMKYSPLLADRVATSSKRGLDCVVTDLLLAMGHETAPDVADSIDILKPFEQHMLKMLYGVFGVSGFQYQNIADHMNISERFGPAFDGLLHRGYIDSYIDKKTKSRHFRVSPSLNHTRLQ